MKAQGILYDKSKIFALDVIALCNELREKGKMSCPNRFSSQVPALEQIIAKQFVPRVHKTLSTKCLSQLKKRMKHTIG